MTEISEQRYKGIGKEEILKIQKVNMTQYHSTLDFNFTKLSDEKVNLDIRSEVEKMIERESHNTEICVLCEMAMRYLDSFSKTEISEQIKDKAEIIAKLISSGQHVELCENKDGLRIVAMERKVVK